MTLQVGDLLFASCSAEIYGEVLNVYKDENHTPVIDLRLNDPDNLVIMFEDERWTEPSLTQLELPEGIKPILKAVQYKVEPERECAYQFEFDGYKRVASVECRTPGDGCFRCTKYFSVLRK